MMKNSHGLPSRLVSILLAGAMITSPVAALAGSADLESLLELDLEALFDVKITTASKVVESSSLAPASVYVITAEQIKRLGLKSLGDVLALVPGVDLVNPHFFLEGGQRGFMGTFSQSLLLINGREMNNLIAGETFIANQFRTHNIKQIEIINGPGSALYGANAVAGVINIITKTSSDIDGVELSVGTGSWKTREAGVVFGREEGELKLYGSFAIFETDGQDFSDFLSDTAKASPRAENNAYRRLPDRYGYDNYSRAIPFSFTIENRGFYGGLEYYQNTMGRGTSGIQWDYTQGEDHRELMMPYIGYRRENLLDDQLDIKLEYRYYEERFWGNHTEGEGPLENPYTGATKTEGITEEDLALYRGFYSNKRSEGSKKHAIKLENTLRLNERNTAVAGIDYEQSDIIGAAWSRTEKPHPPVTDEQRWPEFSNYKWGLYAQDQQKLLDDRVTLTLGVRYNEHERYGSTWNPRGGLVYRPWDTSIFKLLYGESFREPTVFELRNSTAIKPMTMRTYEAGWQQYFGKRFKNSAVVFYNEAQDVIVADSTEEGGISNRGELTAKGFENQFSFQFDRVKGFLNYTYTTSDLDEPGHGNRQVFDIPKHKANLALLYEFIDDYSLGLVARYRSEVDTEYYGETITIDDYVVCDLTVSVMKVPGFRSPASLDITLKNIFDTTYYDPEPRSPSVVKHPQDERSLFVTLTVSL